MAKRAHVPGNDDKSSNVKVACGSLTYKDCLDKESEIRYEKKLQLLDLQLCPYNDKDGWKDDVRMWPDITYPDIYHHLIESPGVFTRESMKCYKSLDSYNYFDSGYVRTVFSKKIGRDNVLFKSEVNHSQKTTDPCKVWICVKKDGSVISSHCNCLAGLGEVCSHVGAVLFKLEACVRLGYNKVACTSKPCKWNQQFNKKVDPVRIIDVDFTQPKRRRTPTPTMGTPSRRPKAPQPLTDVEKELFFEKLHTSGCNSVVLTAHDTLHVHYKPVNAMNKKTCTVLPKPLTERFRAVRPLYGNELLAECKRLAPTLKVTEEEADYIQTVTKNQAESMIWHEQRVGRITASKVFDVLRTNQDKPAKSLLERICVTRYSGNHGDTGIASLDWGIANEKCGVADLVEGLTADHENVQISKCGFHLSPEHPYLGASPDRLVSCNCCGVGGVEIKCPFSQREVCDVASITSTYFDENLRLHKTNPYYHQVQTQLNICNLSYMYSYMYFVLRTPCGLIIS